MGHRDVPKIDLITVGKAPRGALADLCAEYEKRITWPLAVLDTADAAKQLKDGAFVIALDESGQALSSRAFADLLAAYSRVQICIGGPDGHAPAVRARADAVAAFGPQTWPHRLVRLMALEQVYRAQQILAGHPYHRA